MYIRKRGQFYHFEFFVKGKRYAASFNGKTAIRSPMTNVRRVNYAYQERRKVLEGSYRNDSEREA
ncbi:MAG TPA: hypothetical protein VJ180_12995 [Pyrinomonadaceae bacterium]|nr:hypothetical protein [Pyrinomonadaceae bacterium]